MGEKTYSHLYFLKKKLLENVSGQQMDELKFRI